MSRDTLYSTAQLTAPRAVSRHGIARVGRRHFLRGGLALAGAGLLATSALGWAPWRSAAGPPRIGVINGAGAELYVPLLAAFRQGLRDHGYEEGQSIAIEERYLDGRVDRAPEVVQDLLQLGVSAIVSGDAATVRAARRATSTVPIVMVGVAAASAGPERGEVWAGRVGTSTGLSLDAPALPGMRLQLLHELVPDAGLLAVLLDDNAPPQATRVLEQQLAESVQTLGVSGQTFPIRDASDLEPAFQSMRQAGSGGVWVPVTPLTGASIDQILDLVLQYRLPALFSLAEIARGGGVLALSIDRTDLYRRAADYVDKILQCARPSDLPIGQPTAFELVVNLRTAGILGLTVPSSILAKATEIVQ